MALVKADTWILQQIAATGLPLVGGTVSAYVWDTVTPLAMYTDSAGAGSATSFELNSLGMPQSSGGTAIDIFLSDSDVYKFIIRDADGVAVGPTIGPVYPGGHRSGTRAEFSSLEALRASTGTYDYVTVLAANEGGSTGRMELYATGTTGGTPTVTGDRFSALADGTLTNAGGIEFALDTSQIVTPYMFGAVWDGVADDTIPVRLNRDYVVARGRGTVFLPAGRGRITDTIWPGASWIHFLGAGHFATEIIYDNAAGGTAISGDEDGVLSLNNYRYCSFKHFAIASAAPGTDPAITVDFSSFSYSEFDLVIQNRRPNARLYYGQGNAGTAPYYNTIQGYLFGNTDYTQIGVECAQGLWAGGSNGPNANVIGPFARAAALDVVVDLKSGTGNMLKQISGESINTAYFRLNFNPTVADGTSTGTNGQLTFNDAGAAWATSSFIGAAVKITAGTGAGQVRMINTNTATQLSLREPWAVVPDATSEYEIYLGKAQGNKVSQARAEGLASLNPDFIQAYPATDRTEVAQAEVQSLGSGLYVRDESGSPRNSWYSGAKVIMTHSISNPGASANIDIYERTSVFGGCRLAGNYAIEWVKVASNTNALSDAATVTLDTGGTTVGGGNVSLAAVLPNGNSQACAMPGATQKAGRSGTNEGVFLNLQTGASFSATADVVITWCATLLH